MLYIVRMDPVRFKRKAATVTAPRKRRAAGESFPTPVEEEEEEEEEEREDVNQMLDHLVGGMDGDGDDEDDDEDDMIGGVEQVGLPTREKEDRELGPAGDRSTCFGCVYVGEREQTAIMYRDLMDLVEMGRTSMGCTDQITLAKEMARRYAKIRRKCNNQLQPGERPLPRWKAATILEHIRTHNQDPEIQQWVQARDCQELCSIALQAAVVKDRITGKISINKEMFKVYNDGVRLSWFIYKQKPKDAAFYGGGARLDQRSVSQGIIATSGKPVINVWQAKRNKRC